MANPGSLFVTMQPQPGLPLEKFHEWYNNEHGQTRLRLPQTFTNGLRYRAADDQEPAFLAAYDITVMSHLETETYTGLRDKRSPREAETIAQIDVSRQFWDSVIGKQSPLFMPIEQLTDEEAEGLTLVAVQLTPKEPATAGGADDAVAATERIEKWYAEEHMDMLSKVPGWLRSRLFRTSSLEKGAPTRFLALHDYTKTNGIGGPEYQAAISTPRTKELYEKYTTMTSRRIFSLFYVFGPAPRDLHNLSLLPADNAITFSYSPDGQTSTTTKSNLSSSPSPVIESYITTPDGLIIPYRLEGNPSPNAPTIAFCNSLLTSLHMWDRFITILLAARPQYRLLRYDVRGRHSIPTPPKPATVDILAADLATLLDALRIPTLDALIGVSLGGATALRFALSHPERLRRLVACDFNAASAPSNTDAWKGRVAVAETDIAKLAGQTVERWCHPLTLQRKKKDDEETDMDTVTWLRDMVAENNVEGFKYSCQALWDYDLRPEMEGCEEVPALFVVGEGDAGGALVKAMQGFYGLLGKGEAELEIVPRTGHLPMCEDPEGFWKAVETFI